jgi:hypothetical protein
MITDYGKKPRGLDDLFEGVRKKTGFVHQRRKRLPKKVMKIVDSKWWWRAHPKSPYLRELITSSRTLPN